MKPILTTVGKFGELNVRTYVLVNFVSPSRRTVILRTIILKTRSEVKVTVTRKWYATLRHPKMHLHTKFGIHTSKNIGDMDRTRKRDRRTDTRAD